MLKGAISSHHARNEDFAILTEGCFRISYFSKAEMLDVSGPHGISVISPDANRAWRVLNSRDGERGSHTSKSMAGRNFARFLGGVFEVSSVKKLKADHFFKASKHRILGTGPAKA